MRRRTVLRAVGTLTVPGVATFAGCAGSGDDSTDTSGNTVDMVTKGTTYYFDPIGLYVESGETVRFRIESGNHSTTAYTESNPQSDQRRIPDDADAWNSTTLRRGSFDHAFETEGTHDYYCIPHKRLAMVGRIVVGSPGGPAEESPIPDGEVPGSDRIVKEESISWAAFSG